MRFSITTSRFVLATAVLAYVHGLPTNQDPAVVINGTSLLEVEEKTTVYTSCRIPGKVVAMTFGEFTGAVSRGRFRV